MSEISSMEHVMGELDVLEVTETDAALLRDLLEELEDEENMNKDEDNENNCLMQSAVANNTSKNVLEERAVERNDFPIDENGWVETMESTGCSLLGWWNLSIVTTLLVIIRICLMK
ncbi:hypothetical protein L484_020944 [Morus notabilis]|uniref:Uncharacterized protein n=1 Tax=Morus notabilis TaxID=981085 RepID=W9QLI0_9ROSA|nr:hypothetical protein L484_020944 [Morus notabilis]